MTEEAAKYWRNAPKTNKFSCPNVSFFRLLGSIINTLSEKKVLEIGFGDGCDLIECMRRGAKVYGLDINNNYVDNLNSVPRQNLNVARIGSEPIPFDCSFDIIYSRDTICYLNDEELCFFFKDSSAKLTQDGILIIHFIECDLKLKKQDECEQINFDSFRDATLSPIFDKDNPIRFLNSRFLINESKKVQMNLIGSKRMIQSYDLAEEYYRIDRYLVFQKC